MKYSPEATKLLCAATGGVYTRRAPGGQLHLQLGTSRNDTALCGFRCFNWQESSVMGPAFTEHPAHCEDCLERLIELGIHAYRVVRASEQEQKKSP